MRTVAPLILAVGLGSACDTYLPPGSAAGDGLGLSCTTGTACAPVEVTELPSTLRGDSRWGAEDAVDRYACAPSTSEAGNETWYAVELPSAGKLTARLNEVAGDGIDVDVHLLTDLDPDSCVARGHADATLTAPAGTVYVAPGTTWQWQLQGTIDTSFDVECTTSTCSTPRPPSSTSSTPTGGP
jgi:hypothetical protein